MTDARPRLADLLARLYEETPDENRDLVRSVEAAFRQTTSGLHREVRRLRQAAVEYRAERNLLRLVAQAAATGHQGFPTRRAFVGAAVEAIAQMPMVEQGAVVIFDPEGNPSILETIKVPREEQEALGEQLSHGIIARVRELGSEIYTEEAVEDVMLAELASVQALHMRSVLCCPIPGEGPAPPRGAIYIENRSRADAFPEAWREAVRLIAGQIARSLSIFELGLGSHQDPTAPYHGRGRYLEFVGASQTAGRLLYQMDHLLEQRPLPSLTIIGETGVGKELVARSLHRYGPRADGPFVAVNAASLPPSLAESELFGTVAGAFTGARRRQGLFQQANGGILFLDEIGETPPSIQAKLLRVLDDLRVRPVGATEEEAVDVWVIAATNRDLANAVQAGDFRRDLFYRLTRSVLHIPPLRERPADIEALAAHFLVQIDLQQGRKVARVLSPELIVALRALPWDGNVRELQSTIGTMAQRGTGPVLTIDDLRGAGMEATPEGVDEHDTSWDAAKTSFQRRYLRYAIDQWGPAPNDIARRLGIHRTYLYKLCRNLGVERPRIRGSRAPRRPR